MRLTIFKNLSGLTLFKNPSGCGVDDGLWGVRESENKETRQEIIALVQVRDDDSVN